MALVNRRLTDNELAAIYLHVYGNINDFQRLYLIALGKDDPIPPANKRSEYASKWKRTPKIQELIARLKEEKLRAEIAAKDQGWEEGRKAAGESVSPDEDSSKRNTRRLVDYSDPANQTRLLNDIINSAEDTGEQLDALKTMRQGQKDDREAARDRQIQRFYTPEQCKTCPFKHNFAELRRKYKRKAEKEGTVND